jgi:predicted signal transduction protein with EAL and GGDEF domain
MTITAMALIQCVMRTKSGWMILSLGVGGTFVFPKRTAVSKQPAAHV